MQIAIGPVGEFAALTLVKMNEWMKLPEVAQIDQRARIVHGASYGALAAQLDSPRAMRAVGHANGSNPISVVVPCHRLIGADGSLVKYGGGLERKRWLLAHEGVAV